MKNSIFLFFLSFALLLGENQLYAQSNPGFSFARADMIKGLNTYLKSHPKQVQYYNFPEKIKASVINLKTLAKAYDLNPNDLSLKAGKQFDNTFLMLVPLLNTTNPKSRSKSDVMRLPKVRKVLSLTGVYPSRSIVAAFLLHPDGRGGFSIRE